MKNNVREFLDSIDLNITHNNYIDNELTLRHCLEKELRYVAAKIIETNYTLSFTMSLCFVNDFTDYWQERLLKEKDMVYCDNCGKYVSLKNVVEGVYADNGEHYNYTCKICNDS